MADRDPVKPEIVWQAIVDRLIAEIDFLNAKRCVFSIPNSSFDPNPGDVWVGVWPAGGEFDFAAIAGGGRSTMFYRSEVRITVYSGMMLDQAGKAKSLLNDSRRGFYPIVDQIVTALTDRDLMVDTEIITAEGLVPRIVSESSHNEGFAPNIDITFEVAFLWDVS